MCSNYNISYFLCSDISHNPKMEGDWNKVANWSIYRSHRFEQKHCNRNDWQVPLNVT